MKIILYLYLILLSHSPTEKFSPEGIWTRVGDEWQGMEVRVSKTARSYDARITSVPPPAHKWGFRKGDLKWIIESDLSENPIHFSDLYITRATENLYYQKSLLEIVSADTLRTSLIKFSNEYIGREQTWVRKNPEIAMANDPK